MNEDKKYYCQKCGKEIGYFDAKYGTGLCYSCNKERTQDELAENLKSDEVTETSCEDNIVCPYCGCQIEDDCGEFSSAGSGTYECPDCGKEFNFEADVSVTFSTYRI